MRIPDMFFPVVNRVMRLLLHSPLHRLMSGNIMVLYFRGRRSGRRRWTPVRYLREGEGSVFCLTGRETGWWPNLLDEAPVELRLAGRRVAATAQALPDDAQRKDAALRRMLGRFPADAAYHGIVLRRGEGISEEQYRQAVARDVLVVFQLAEQRTGQRTEERG